MRPRPIRSKIYLPVVRFGVVSTDWKFVLGIVIAGYAIPFWFDLKVGMVPMELLTSIGSGVLSIAFFNFVRLGRRPYWFQHHIASLFSYNEKGRWLPSHGPASGGRPWILSRERRNR